MDGTYSATEIDPAQRKLKPTEERTTEMDLPEGMKVVQNHLGEEEFSFDWGRAIIPGIVLIAYSLISIWLGVAEVEPLFSCEGNVFWSHLSGKIVVILFLFALGITFVYLALLCFFGKVYVKIENGMFILRSGVFGLYRNRTCALANIESASTETKVSIKKHGTISRYYLVLHLRNGRKKWIPFRDYQFFAEFFTAYLNEKI